MTKKILIIEDEQAQQDAYRLKLSENYLLTFVSTEAEMRTVLQVSKPELIILDIMLPGGKNGFDILQELKGSEETKQIPVLMLTNLDGSQRKTALELGASEYVLKTTVGPKEIEELVRKYIGE